ncbi:hypothetical protein KP509_18G000600 [Ceratopteris richardii]|uniref:Transcription factor CBF/NF-Y/archaeal histone domain-containing protein n=1 Tax=Ceratopteris richardii TaxID=49495 RepID=A0A8T2SLV5_CERRI|nr:hypothetical protein KP509_18G000600 [Ceratopteris richardii]
MDYPHHSPESSHPSDEEVGPHHGGGELYKEQDRLLPIANVSRIMKRALPPNAKISKDAKEALQECVSEFISFITVEASDKCQREKRKTVNGDDLLWAMGSLSFNDYIEPLKFYLQRYRDVEGEKAFMTKQRDQDIGNLANERAVHNNMIKGIAVHGSYMYPSPHQYLQATQYQIPMHGTSMF